MTVPSTELLETCLSVEGMVTSLAPLKHLSANQQVKTAYTASSKYVDPAPAKLVSLEKGWDADRRNLQGKGT